MRIDIGTLDLGTADEIQFFLEREDRTGQFFYLRLSPRGGVLRLPLDNAVGQPFYREAVDAAQGLINGALDGAATR